MDGPDITKKLVAIRGIGDWTADNYRLFVLADMDAWPYNDLALQEGMKILKSLNTRPDAKTMINMGEAGVPSRCWGFNALACLCTTPTCRNDCRYKILIRKGLIAAPA